MNSQLTTRNSQLLRCPTDFNPFLPTAPLHRELHPQAAPPPEADNAPPNTLDFRSSDQTLDRYQEVITVSGWKLENYRKNPVVQNAHSYGSLMDTIGKSLITEIRSGAPVSAAFPRSGAPVSAAFPDSGAGILPAIGNSGAGILPAIGNSGAGILPALRGSGAGVSPATPYLFQRIVFAVNENPLAKIAYGLYKGGFLSAVSVGFIPLRWENGSKELGYRRKYVEQELLEVSAVSIPANPNAIALALKAGAVEKSELRELAQLLTHFCRETENTQHATRNTQHEPSATAPITNHESRITSPICTMKADRIPDTSALGSAIDEARLLQLTKQLHEIKKVLKHT